MNSIAQGQTPTYCLAPPTNDPVLFNFYNQKFKNIVDNHKDINDLRTDLVGQIKEIAKTNAGISNMVNICQIKKGEGLQWMKL